MTSDAPREDSTAEAAGASKVGWLLDSPQPHVLFVPPSRLRWPADSTDHAKSATRCPAMAAAASRTFSLPCPYDLKLGFTRTEAGVPELVDLDGDQSAMREELLDSFVALSPEKEWRSPDRPIVQMALPYVFVADQVTFLTQAAPSEWRREPWPGVVMRGRFPIHVWPRPLAWAFEWFAPDRPLHLRRGESLCEVRFETETPAAPVRLVEAVMTDELQVFLDEIGDVASYAQNTFSLFPAAERMRPKRLLVERDRSG